MNVGYQEITAVAAVFLQVRVELADIERNYIVAPYFKILCAMMLKNLGVAYTIDNQTLLELGRNNLQFIIYLTTYIFI